MEDEMTNIIVILGGIGVFAVLASFVTMLNKTRVTIRKLGVQSKGHV